MKREQLYRLNNIGVAFMEQFKHEDAVKQFKQALERDPNFAVARINLALAHFYLNDSRAAVDEARAAVKLAPDSPHAHYALAAALRNEKLYDESLAEFNKVLSIDPRDSATNIQIGQLHSQKQQYPQAIAAFQRAIESEPYNATAVYSLAQALIRSGQQPKARRRSRGFSNCELRDTRRRSETFTARRDATPKPSSAPAPSRTWFQKRRRTSASLKPTPASTSKPARNRWPARSDARSTKPSSTISSDASWSRHSARASVWPISTETDGSIFSCRALTTRANLLSSCFEMTAASFQT